MEQPFSTSKVTVEYFDPHDVYKLIAPGLVPRLPLKSLHWQSHAGPLRSIDTLHVELVESGSDSTPPATANSLKRTDSTASRDDGFQTQAVGGRPGSVDQADAASVASRSTVRKQRHQIPGLRRTPYLKVLFVRIDDSEAYRSSVKAEIKEWLKNNTPGKDKKASKQEKHDAFEWLIVHVVIPNTVASTQPRVSGSETSGGEKSSSSIWKSGSSTLWEKLRTDFNKSSSVDRVAQIRIGINDVPYDMLPRVVPAVPTGYQETAEDTKNAWQDLILKLKSQILASFDMRVSQYEEDIKEKDSQRSLPGWNFCTFFMLKEGLARGFESVGLVEDALVGYDELTVGLDSVVQEQALAGSAEEHGGSLLPFTEDLKSAAERALASVTGEDNDEEEVDLQSANPEEGLVEDIAISSTKKPYRDMILANNVSIFDFRCYIFARQISLLLRLGNAWSSREELLAKLKEQQDSVLHGIAPQAPPPKTSEDPEKLDMLAEICRRTLEFIPILSQVMRQDIVNAMTERAPDGAEEDTQSGMLWDPVLSEIIDNMVASFAFSVAQQILAQTSTKSLPIPPSSLTPDDGQEQKNSIPEPKTMMHPARHSSLNPRSTVRQPPSPGVFPGPGSPEVPKPSTQFMKPGLEELAARRAELYTLSRNILEERGKQRDWNGGWADVPVLGAASLEDLEEVSLDDEQAGQSYDEEGVKSSDEESDTETVTAPRSFSVAGFDNKLLRMALQAQEDFYRLYETLTDKALRHYSVASHNHSVQANKADLAVLKYHLQDYNAASTYFYQATPFFGDNSWSLLELSMLCMYANCLKKLGQHDKYICAVLKLLSKAASAERERLEERSSLRIGPNTHMEYPESLAVKGFLGDVLDVANSVNREYRLPLANILYSMEIQGSPEYHDRKDGFSLKLKLRSLIPDDLPIEKAKIRLSGPHREIWVEMKDMVVINPGLNTLTLDSCVIVPGNYIVDRVFFYTHNLFLPYEREANVAPSQDSALLKNPSVVLFQRADALDISLSTTRLLQLDKNTHLDLVLRSGWNQIKSCEVRIRPATGGLRLLVHDAHVVDSQVEFSKPADHAMFSFDEIDRDTSVTIRFPITLENDVLHVSIKVEVFFTTEHGNFTFAKTPTVPIALALGVNVQDVFKHKALFSRFTVSTASHSPMRLFESKLMESDVYSSSFGLPPEEPVTIFPKQPASLLYKIQRKKSVSIAPNTKKTMYLKLLYSVLQEEIDNLVEKTFAEELEGSDLWQYYRPILATVLSHFHASLSGHDLERSALMGHVATDFLTKVKWTRFFAGVGNVPGTHDDDAATRISDFVLAWQKRHALLEITTPEPSTAKCVREILIAVDIPPITVVHTADIQIQSPVRPTGVDVIPGAAETVCTNQLLPALLHLRWTRWWDTTGRPPQDLEFSYEVSSPGENWLVGGRRKGHFVIPGVDTAEGKEEEVSMESAAATEADIPLLLSPLREGWLPYPQVDVREVRNEDGSGIVVASHGHCETDFRNLGETVRVVQDWGRITMSLDSSGPGGGPLVLGSEMREAGGRVVL